MKFAFSSIITVLIFSAGPLFAQQKPNDWLCSVKSGPRSGMKPDEVRISLKEPTVTRSHYFKKNDGTVGTQIQKLITETTVSSWIAKLANCQIRRGYRQGEFFDAFDFNFRCGVVRGGFQMDFKRSEGFYNEAMDNSGGQVGSHFSLEKCRPATDFVDSGPTADL